MTVRYTDTELTADSEHELETFVTRSLLLPKSRIVKTLDGPVLIFESASERIISFAMGANHEDDDLRDGLCVDLRCFGGVHD